MHGLVNIQHPGGAPAKSIELKRPVAYWIGAFLWFLVDMSFQVLGSKLYDFVHICMVW